MVRNSPKAENHLKQEKRQRETKKELERTVWRDKNQDSSGKWEVPLNGKTNSNVGSLRACVNRSFRGSFVSFIPPALEFTPIFDARMYRLVAGGR